MALLKTRWKRVAKYNECVSAGESTLMMLALFVLDRRADGFGEGVRTVILRVLVWR